MMTARGLSDVETEEERGIGESRIGWREREREGEGESASVRY